MNAAQNMRLKMKRKKYSIIKKADLILKKDMEQKKITREKTLKLWSVQYVREF